MMKIKEKYFRPLLLLAFLVNMILASADLLAAEPIKIGLIQGLGGPLDVYARQEITGFKMGLEYATQGTNKIIGRDVKLIIEETQSKPRRGVTLLTKLYKEDRVDIADKSSRPHSPVTVPSKKRPRPPASISIPVASKGESGNFAPLL